MAVKTNVTAIVNYRIRKIERLCMKMHPLKIKNNLEFRFELSAMEILIDSFLKLSSIIFKPLKHSLIIEGF